MNSFYDLFKLIREKKIRNGDILKLISKEDENFTDYYIVENKDIYSLLSESTLFDNFYILDLLDKYFFKVVYKKEEKEKIFEYCRMEKQ